MPKPVILPPTDKTPEQIAQAILNYQPTSKGRPVPKDHEQTTQVGGTATSR